MKEEDCLEDESKGRGPDEDRPSPPPRRVQGLKRSGKQKWLQTGRFGADQWGEGGIGALTDDNTKSNKDAKVIKKVTTSGGFGKAEAVAIAGAQKVKKGTSTSMKWFKNKCQKKTPTEAEV